MNNISIGQAPRDGWRHLLVMLAMCAVGFLGQPDPAAAQVQTYYYQGPAFDIGTCETLAEKVRRGLRGRVEAGKSGGGNSFGYDVVRRFNAAGEPIRGERVINPGEAGIVRRIFNEFARGDSRERSPAAWIVSRRVV
jgi:hypothetical protein